MATDTVGAQSNDDFALGQPIAPRSKKVARTPIKWVDRDGHPLDAVRSDQLTRASNAYADALAALNPRPGIAADLMREQFAEQVDNPTRYHQIDEVENSKGLRIGDYVVRPSNLTHVLTVTSITSREVRGAPFVQVHTIAPDSYGGWGSLSSYIKLNASDAANLAEMVAQAKTNIDTAGDANLNQDAKVATIQRIASGETSAAKLMDANQERRNRRAITAAAKWGIDADILAPDEHGWIVPRFEVLDHIVDLRDKDGHVKITVAQAPNGNWACASSYAERNGGHTSLPFPNDAYVQHPTQISAIRASLAYLKNRVSTKLYAKALAAAEPFLTSESTKAGQPNDKALAPRKKIDAQKKSNKAPTTKTSSTTDNTLTEPERIEQARMLLAQYLAEANDLFGDVGIHLLAGPDHVAKRMQLLTLLNGTTKMAAKDASVYALRDAFYPLAGISKFTDPDREAVFSNWLKIPAPISIPSPREVGNNESLLNALPIAGSSNMTNEPGRSTIASNDQHEFAAEGVIAAWVAGKIKAEATFTSAELFAIADGAFGGTQAEGRYSVKDAYDAMELGVNRFILDAHITPTGSPEEAGQKLQRLEQLVSRLPTQTRRTGEMEEYQQFSSPPPLAFIAAWTAHIRTGETMVEPSAGIGGIALFGALAGAELTVNELSHRRASLLHMLLPLQRQFTENAEQLHNILPDDIQPTVIVMNPPFSAAAERMPGARTTDVGARHIEQALQRLASGGRLVAIVGQGMAMDRPGFKNWWDEIKNAFNVRANIAIDGKLYQKYGTAFGTQLLVIDKAGRTSGPVLTARADNIAQLPPLLEEIRNDRATTRPSNSRSEPPPAERGGPDVSAGAAGDAERIIDIGPDALGLGQRVTHQDDSANISGSGTDRSNDRPALPDTTHAGDRLSDKSRTPTGRRDSPERGGTGERDDGAGGGDHTTGSAVQQHDRNEAINSSDVTVGQRPSIQNKDAISDAIYEEYMPQRLTIPGAHAHPGKLVQSAAMAAIEPPAPTYVPNLPNKVVDLGLLSLAQLETVVYAGQAHEQRLPNGQRRGFFIGDGTGVGKGREIAGVILDNLRSGRRKAVWISEKAGLLRDARRDFSGIGEDGAVLFAQGRVKPEDSITNKDGILFASYTLLASGQKKALNRSAKKSSRTRLQQLVEWLGADFDGVIAFDESHNMANAVGKRGARGMAPPAAKALVGIALQDALPNARIMYVSATGATEVSNLVYANRLGLWGEGTPFAKAADFTTTIDAGGVAAMELVSRDMKAMGAYLARSLSFDGVSYERLEHKLTPLQTDIYNELAGIWQTVLQNVNAALSATGQGKDGAAKSAALSRFWGAHQRFFNQIITAMQMPTVIAQAHAELEIGNAIIMQLVNTNEAAQERQVADLAAAGAELEEMDFTPRQNLIDYVKTGFPTQQYEEYKDNKGNVLSRPVVDAQGKPVFSKEMEAKRDALVQTLVAIRVPDNPIDTILNAFGPEMVAEVTGRSRRFILERNAEGDVKPVEQKRPPSAAVADAESFMDGKKMVLVFSDAGGTGYSFHADLTRPNQRKRIHYLIQPGWRAEKAVQGLGRSHRTNEASQPHYVLPTTNLEAQRRFISSIARRLDQLGALTKGQRQTGSQGLFSASDNLESEYARRALRIMFNDMYLHRSPLDFAETTHAMGLNGLIDKKTGALNESKLPTIPQFLNRLLSLKTFEQDRVFGEFFRGMEFLITMAKQQGTYDMGVETIRAQSIVKQRDEIVHTDARTGAETHYIELALHHPTRRTSFSEIDILRGESQGSNFLGFFRNEKTNHVIALQKTGQSTNEHGQLVSRGRQFSPTGPVRYVDNIDHVISAAEGNIMIKRRERVPVYAGKAFNERWTRNGRDFYEQSCTASIILEHHGLAAFEALPMKEGISAEQKAALERVVERIKSDLSEKEVDRQVQAYTKLSLSDAKLAWDAELSAAPKTYVQREHLITGALLPIWDRIPGSPRVIRTQTDDGERLLGRTVAPSMLTQTLKNLCVASDISNISPNEILERILAGDKAVLANGWEVKSVMVSHEQRIEIMATTMSYGDRLLLEKQGAFCERIQWKDRIFIPTGTNAIAVLSRILKAKPVVDLYEKNAKAPDEDPSFSLSATSPHIGFERTGTDQEAMTLAAIVSASATIAARWTNAPAIKCVQSVMDLPFPARENAQGAYYKNVVYLVADNIFSDAELQYVIGHEVLGHAGLHAILDQSELTQEMTRLRLINPRLAQAARHICATYGLGINLATEEALSDIAGKRGNIAGMRTFIFKIQQALRKVGLDKLSDWLEGKTQAETMGLMRRAKLAIVHGDKLSSHRAIQVNLAFSHHQATTESVQKLNAPYAQPPVELNIADRAQPPVAARYFDVDSRDDAFTNSGDLNHPGF